MTDASDPPWHTLVVVPAHDEAQLIGRCLRALREAVDQTGRLGHRSHVVVVADACTDCTAARARTLLRSWGEVVEVGERSVGQARAIGVRRGLDVFAAATRSRLWVANTDADSAVPASWLSRQLIWATRGYVAVAGTVTVDSFAGHPPDVPSRFMASYAAQLKGGDPPVHGANLGVRADAYLAIAGWPPVPLAEDHRLWDGLRSTGWPIVADPDPELQVMTSGRPVGRAPGGFAETLSAFTAFPCARRVSAFTAFPCARQVSAEQESAEQEAIW